MLRVGLTGGIACGKTTVVAMLRELACAVLEADPLAHRLIEPDQPAYQEVVQEFGRDILFPDGFVDRTKLAEIVFVDPNKLARLNRIVHPRVMEAADQWLASQERAGTPVAFVEAALLIEASYHRHVDRVMVVCCPAEQQLARLLGRGMSEEQARQRVAAQMPLEEKRRIADIVIDTSGSMEQTRQQVEGAVRKLRQEATGQLRPAASRDS